MDDGLTDYGVFVGASIYELGQVYGASFAVSEGAVNTVTLVKLSKVLMLIPLLLVLGLLRRRSDAASKSVPVPFPWFIAAFVGVMLLNSSFTLHPVARSIILEIDQFLFLMVMVALGLTTRLALLGQARGAGRLISGRDRASALDIRHLRAGGSAVGSRQRRTVVGREH